MKSITATALARNLGRVWDRLATEGGELTIEHNSRALAYLKAAPAAQNAFAVMADLDRTLPKMSAGKTKRERGKGMVPPLEGESAITAVPDLQ